MSHLIFCHQENISFFFHKVSKIICLFICKGNPVFHYMKPAMKVNFFVNFKKFYKNELAYSKLL